MPRREKKTASYAKPVNEVVSAVATSYRDYIRNLTPRLKLIDSFLAFLVALGGLQFLYVLLIGNFPFNAFLGGFISCVGQFVLTVSLRLQFVSGTEQKKTVETEDGEVKEMEPVFSITPQRAFGDYIFASLLLHFVVLHFIN